MIYVFFILKFGDNNVLINNNDIVEKYVVVFNLFY